MSRLSAITIVALCGQAAFATNFFENGYNLTVPANVTTISGDYREYEAENNLTVQSRLEYREGSSGVLAAGNRIHLRGEGVSLPSYSGSHPDFVNSGRKMGFMAHDGATIWGFIDSNFNGISDYIEELDADGDGLFDALENALGTSNNIGIIGYETDVNGDGIGDKVTNASTGGTSSQFIPGVVKGYLNASGYNGNMSSFYQINGTYYSLSVSFGDPGFVNYFFPSISEWFDFYYTVTYSYFDFEGWTQGTQFFAESGTEYSVQAYYHGGDWQTITQFSGAGQMEDIYYGRAEPDGSVGPFDFLWEMPNFLRIVKLGVQSYLIASLYSDVINSVDVDATDVEPEVEDAEARRVRLTVPDRSDRPTDYAVIQVRTPNGTWESVTGVVHLGNIDDGGKISVVVPEEVNGQMVNQDISLSDIDYRIAVVEDATSSGIGGILGDQDIAGIGLDIPSIEVLYPGETSDVHVLNGPDLGPDTVVGILKDGVVEAIEAGKDGIIAIFDGGDGKTILASGIVGTLVFGDGTGIPSTPGTPSFGASGPGLIPRYKSAYDPNREDYLGTMNLRQTSGTSGVQVRVEAQANGSKVKVFDSPTSTAQLTFPRTWDLATAPEKLYFEGANVSSNVDDVKFKLVYLYDDAQGNPQQFESVVSSTVYDIASIAWLDNYSNQLSQNVDHAGITMPGGGKRIFPGQQNPSDTANRKTVKMRSTITPQIQGIDIHFQVFDVDDPSANNGPIDPTSTQDDNRGTLNQPSNAAVATNASGIAETNFDVSMHPGDNFRCVAALDASMFTGLLAKKEDGSNARIRDASNNFIQDVGSNSDSPYAITALLTVWRKMHVEVDSMGPVSGNEITGTIDAVNNPTLGPWRRVETGQAYADSNNRFEKGEFRAGGKVYEITDNSGSTNLKFGIKKDVVVSPAQPTVPSVNDTFVAVDDDKSKDSSGNPLDVRLPNTSHIATAFAPAYVEPDFDGGDPTNSHNNSNVPFTLNVLEDSNASAIRNQLSAGRGSPVGTEDYWIVYVQGAYQGDFDKDYDPGNEDPQAGITADIENAPSTANLEEGCLIYSELIDDFNIKNPSNVQNEAWVVAHEVGHLFVVKGSSTDDHSQDDSLMDEGNIVNPTFNNQDLDDIRNTKVP